MNKVLVHVNIDSFEGQIVNGGEYISRCKRGDVIEIEKETYLSLLKNFPDAFLMYNPAIEIILRTKEEKIERNELRILYLYMDDIRYRYDHWLRGDFIKQVPKYSNHTSIFFYGLNSHLIYPQETPIKYNSKLAMKEICSTLDIDIIIIAQKSRMHPNYSPFKIDNISWLPSDFSTIDIPKIVIEEDYHYEKDDSWYVKNNVNLILQRHYSQSLRQERVPMKWFPFSVDIEVFKPTDEIKKRINKFSFVGSMCDACYVYRSGAVRLLQNRNWVDVFAEKQVVHEKYVKNLQDYISHVCCGSTFEITPGKALEIMASGSVLFTNKFTGIDKMFSDDAYISYKNDLSDVLSQAQKILSDEEMVRETVKKGLENIRKHHTHEIRINELLSYIKIVIKKNDNKSCNY